MRIYFQNVNGIKSNAKEWEEMIKNLATNQVAIFGMAETNFNWTPISTKICINRAKASIRRELGKREKPPRAKGGMEGSTSQEVLAQGQ